MSAPSIVKVVLAYPPQLEAGEIAALGDVSGVEVVHCPFEEPYDQRTARRRGDHVDDLAELGNVRRSAFAREVLDADVIFALDLPTEIDVLAPRLQWVQAVGSGTEHFRTVGLGPSVVLTNSSGVSAPSIAEFVVARLLGMWKNLDRLATQQREHMWQPIRSTRFAGRTVVVVGFGAIGQAVAVLAHGLGMNVIGVRRRPEPHRAASEVVSADRLHEVLSGADAAVLCASLNNGSRHLFDATAFAAMPAGSIFCNVGRGLTVDEAALVTALTTGQLRAAAIDVMHEEPLPVESPLWDVPNLHISPHCAGASDSGHTKDALRVFGDNLRRWLQGEQLHNIVDLTQDG